MRTHALILGIGVMLSAIPMRLWNDDLLQTQQNSSTAAPAEIMLDDSSTEATPMEETVTNTIEADTRAENIEEANANSNSNSNSNANANANASIVEFETMNNQRVFTSMSQVRATREFRLLLLANCIG